METTKVVEKKKRGRPKLKNKEKKSTEKKKRGRKPKPVVDEPKIPKKRGRKPKKNLAEVVDNKKDITKEEQVIVHLPIKNIDINLNLEDEFIKYNPEIGEPTPYNVKNDFFVYDNKEQNKTESKIVTDKCESNECKNSNCCEQEKEDNEEVIAKYINLKESYENDENYLFNKHKISHIFLEYSICNNTKKWPSKTNIDCLWCCHPFDNMPFGIPIKKREETIHIFGNFCSPECAAAYNFDMYGENNETWERYSLINYLYQDKHPIKLAPPRLTLKKFGGRFSIKEYRKHNTNYDVDYKLLLPPIISIIPAVEELNLNNNKNSNFNILNTELKLKRSKPINKDNTLEACMNLKYM